MRYLCQFTGITIHSLDLDYGDFDNYHKPKNPHPDSILWRSHYFPENKKSDILHGQQKYWGLRDIHYHQFLEAGENTLNLQLSAELYRHIILDGEFNIENWLRRYTEVMLTPGWHNDTYVEEYHRAFFFEIMEEENLFTPVPLKTTTSVLLV